MEAAGVRRVAERVLDPVLAAAVVAIGYYEIWLESGAVSGPPVGNTVFLVLVALPLVWRRRFPLAVLAVVTIASIGWSYAWYFERQTIFAPFIAVLLSTYAVAATAVGWRVWAGAGLVASYVGSDLVAMLSGPRPDETGAAWVFLGLTWAIARVVHRQRMLATALTQRAAELEREREEKAQLAVALERARIARELHDVVTHNVSVMVVQASAERRVLAAGVESTREVLCTIEQTGRDTLVELRRVLGVLRKDDESTTLTPQPTLARLDELLDQTRDAGIPVDLRIHGQNLGLPAGVELSAYRIVQEALTNILNHAGPARAEVVVRYGPSDLELEVTDDGRGVANGQRAGNGMLGMRERVAMHGGVFEAGPRHAGGGFRVYARLPIGAGT